VFLSLGQASDAWPTTSPSSVTQTTQQHSPHSSDTATTRICLSRKRILPLYAPHLLFHSKQVLFLVPLPFRQLTKTIGRKPSTNTHCTPTSTLFPTSQKRAPCFARSQYLTCCRRTSQQEQTSLWLRVRLVCIPSSCEADCGYQVISRRFMVALTKTTNMLVNGTPS
jgi:hypothetical protein